MWGAAPEDFLPDLLCRLCCIYQTVVQMALPAIE